jgi:transcriptional regulator with XRE-family HTH domain
MMKYRGKVAPDGSLDPMLPTVAKTILEGSISMTALAERSGVSQTTMRAWISGKTKRPQRVTIDFVLQRLGKRLAIVDKAAHPATEPRYVKTYAWSPADIVRRRGSQHEARP